MLKSLNLKSHLELGRTLADEGASVDAINGALGQVGGTPLAHSVTQDAGPLKGLSYERLQAQLGEIEFQRQTAESLLEHLRAESAAAATSSNVSEEEVAREFYAMPAVAKLNADLEHARASYEEIKRLSRQPNDPARVHHVRLIKDLAAELSKKWRTQKPRIQAVLAGTDGDDAIHQASGDVMQVSAKGGACRGQGLPHRQDHHEQAGSLVCSQEEHVRQRRERGRPRLWRGVQPPGRPRARQPRSPGRLAVRGQPGRSNGAGRTSAFATPTARASPWPSAGETTPRDASPTPIRRPGPSRR